MGSQIVDQKNRVIRIVVMFTLGVLPLAYFIFAFQDLQNSISWCFPLRPSPLSLCSSL